MHEIVWTGEKINALWDFYSRDPERRSQYFSLNFGRDIIRYVKQYIDFSNIRSVLDFGCGPGYLMKYLFDSCRSKIYGLDFFRESIEQVKKEFSDRSQFAGAVCVGSLPSEFKSGSMDLVFSIEVIEHLSDRQLEETLQEIHRLLMPGGMVVITTPNRENLEASKTMCPECGCVFHRWQHIRTWDDLILKHLIEKSGFCTIVCRPVEAYKPRTYRRLLKAVYRLFSRSSSVSSPFLIYIGKKT